MTRVGLTWRDALRWPIEVAAERGLIDAVEVVPSGYCRHGLAELLESRLAILGLPYSFHFVDLSLASADALENNTWPRVREFLGHFEPLFVSDHLTACRAGDLDLEVNLPVEASEAATEIYVENVRAFLDEVRPGTFLLEHVPQHWRLAEDTRSAAEVYGEVLRGSGCGALLDVHNLYCDELNLGLDPLEVLERVEDVREIHVAGGHTMEGGWRVDGHDHAVPERVFEILALALQRFDPELIVLEREHRFEDLDGLFADLERIHVLAA